MTRIVTREDTGPYRLAKADIQGDAAYICRCGLSKNQPFCDSSHKLARDEPPGQLIRYIESDGERLRQAIHVQPVEAPTQTRSQTVA